MVQDQGWGAGKFFSGSGSCSSLIFQAAPAPVFFPQAAPAPSISFPGAPGQKHPAPAPWQNILFPAKILKYNFLMLFIFSLG